MLVGEALLILTEDPHSITLPEEGDPIVAQEILTGPPYAKAKTVFDFSQRWFALPSLP
jgi:E3 ubiquitin-protein ligase HUWE1